jgi:hypothetical protein
MGEVTVDLTKLQEQVKALTPAEVEEKLKKIRVRDKVTQKKSYNSDTAKRYQLKARETKKALKEQAIGMLATRVDPETITDANPHGSLYTNLWEQINAEAEELANEKLAEGEIAGDDAD